jgi:chromosome segregation ATPase
MPVERTIAWWEECVADLDKRVTEAKSRAEAAEAERDRYKTEFDKLMTQALDELEKRTQAEADRDRWKDSCLRERHELAHLRADRDRLQANEEFWRGQHDMALAAAQTLRDALEQTAEGGEEFPSIYAANVLAALAAPDTPPDA